MTTFTPTHADTPHPLRSQTAEDVGARLQAVLANFPQLAAQVLQQNQG